MESKSQFDFNQYLSTMKTAHVQINDPEEYLFNIVSCCLLKEIRYYDSSEERSSVLLSALNKVANEYNPEFILKLALYLRHQLYIRTTTNFLLAFSCMHEKTKIFVKKYFCATVLLPTDLIEVCSYVQYLSKQLKIKENIKEKKMEVEEDDIRKKFVFPKILKECIAEKFPQFSLYQLGKYCSDGSRKKMLINYLQFKNITKFQEIQEKKRKTNKEKLEKQQEENKKQNQNKKVLLQKNIKKHQKISKNINKTQKKNQFDVKFLCMKDIIRFSHIKSPQYPIRCILGVKYPETEEQFNELFKDDILKYQLKSNTNQLISFNQELAKKRMKLDIPQTWETQLSAKGNKKEVWEELIMSNQVPYMALMRNLRNILKSGVSDVVHQKVIARLTDINSVKNSKMFPFQYFSALVEIDKLINCGTTQEELKQEMMEQEFAKIIAKSEAGEYNSDEFDPEVLVEQQLQKMQNKDLQLPQETKDIIKHVGPLYKQAINKAINIAVDQNLEPIRGLTLVFADVSGSMRSPISGGKRYGSIRDCFDIAILFGLMIRSKCANCQFYLFSSPGKKPNKLYQKVKFPPTDDYLENLKLCKKQNHLGGGNTGFPGDCIKKYQNKKIKIDNIIILSDLMISVNYSEGMDYGIENNNNNRISDVLNEYRNKMNENLKIFSIDLRGYSQQLNLADEFNEKNYIRIFGMSDSVLRFISLRENSQMQEIHNFAEAKIAEYENNLIK